MEEDSAPRNLNAGAPAPTCVRLFGVQLTDSNHRLACHDMGSLRKSVSMGNLGLVGVHASSQIVPHCTQPAHADLEGEPHPPLDGAAAHSEPQQGYLSDGLMQSSSMNLRERKKGVPWTEDEHRLFLAGLQKLGKGDWRGISRNFVTTRTPTQVASHAQKYFLRQSNLNKRKRSSLFDIINANAAFGKNAIGDLSQTFGATVAEALVWPALELNLRHPMVSFSSPLDKGWSSVCSKPPSSVPHSVCADLCLASSHSQRWEASPDNVTLVHATAQDKNKLALLSSKKSLANNGSLESSCQSKSLRTISSSSSSSKSASSSSLCRIDEMTELSSLSLSIGPPMPMEASELVDLKPEQPVASKLSIISPAKVSEHREVLLTMGAGTAAGNANKVPGMSSAIRVI